MKMRAWDKRGIVKRIDLVELRIARFLLRDSRTIPVFAADISDGVRKFVLKHLGRFYCQMCGAGAGDPDPYHPGLKIRLTMGHIIDKSKGGEDTPDNLRAACTNCNQGLQNASPPKPDRIELLKQVRRATIDDQQHLRDWLEKKFEKIRPAKK